MKYRVLVIDDEPSICRTLSRVLVDEGYQVEVAATGEAGLSTLVSARPEIVLLDLKLPDANGLELLERIRNLDQSAQVILITAYGDTKAAVRAMKLGASDFLRKPYDLDELLLAVETAGRAFAREAELDAHRLREQERYGRSEAVFASPVMSQVWNLVLKAARSDAPSILITGESGTGKELVARALHFESARRSAPFLELNCSNFQETLVENELFGHERGAYTGANLVKRGLLEINEGGTLLLDEVAEMPLTSQAKLLRFLEDQTFRRLGGTADISVDLRILAATNVDLDARIHDGRFRMDLFYRLKVVSIELPPLRDRGDDAVLLADHFLRKFSTKYHKRFRTTSEEVRPFLRSYAWPGNVRELRNLVERVVLIEDGELFDVKHLPAGILHAGAPARPATQAPVLATSAIVEPGGDSSASWNELVPLREVEESYILHVLGRCQGNKSQAARVLGLSRQGLLDRLKRLDPSNSVSLPS